MFAVAVVPLLTESWSLAAAVGPPHLPTEAMEAPLTGAMHCRHLLMARMLKVVVEVHNQLAAREAQPPEAVVIPTTD